MKTVWVWEREDGEEPCLLQVGRRPRGPGEVFEVTGCKGRIEAQNTVRLAYMAEPDVEESPAEWARWKGAVKRVRKVSEEEFGD